MSDSVRVSESESSGGRAGGGRGRGRSGMHFAVKIRTPYRDMGNNTNEQKEITGPENPICVRFTNSTYTRLLFGSLPSRHTREVIDTLSHQRDACWK